MDVHKTIVDGTQAQQLLENETLKAILESIEESYIQGWRTSEASDYDGRERLYLALQILEHIKTHLRVVAEAGKLATAQIERLKNRRGIQ